MDIYLVGGAVRDQLLGLPVTERDWVVVGATPALMLQQGYQKVGRDFPVFLHPKTREEYALARIERKSGSGYYGFSCDFNEQVTLEEDLARRDLTINAMAMDEKGRLIDPYQGQKDLQAKKLRHVSAAFTEDPVRVLRVARFAARYHHLGFTLADETRCLMYQMSENGELAHLVPERVWQEWVRSLGEKDPQVFIEVLRACNALKRIIPELDRLFGVPNPLRYHPEIDSGIHSLLVLKYLKLQTDDPLLRFAALVHDVGKGETPMAIWPSHYGHDEKGVGLIHALSERLRIPNEYRSFAKMVSKLHLLIHRLPELRAGTVLRVFEQAQAFRNPDRFEKLLQVCEADTLGRHGAQEYAVKNQWLALLKECLNISVQAIITEGYQGAAIKEELSRRRIACIQNFL